MYSASSANTLSGVATQAERRTKTTERLIDAAERCFARQGIAATSTEEILREAGTSRGAMYHHFATRDDLVAAVYERVVVRTLAAALPAGRGLDPPDRLVAVSRAWLHEARRTANARILVLDGPAALGHERASAIESRHSRPLVEASLLACASTGAPIDDPAITASLINAVLADAALLVCTATPRRRTAVLATVESEVERLLRGVADPAVTRAAATARSRRGATRPRPS
jgi:AcrR family transcriptional regulator